MGFVCSLWGKNQSFVWEVLELKGFGFGEFDVCFGFVDKCGL